MGVYKECNGIVEWWTGGMVEWWTYFFKIFIVLNIKPSLLSSIISRNLYVSPGNGEEVPLDMF